MRSLGMTASTLRYCEPATIAASVHCGIIHLLRVGRRPHEGARRRRTGDVRDLERALPQVMREPVDAIVADLLVLPRRPPAAVPAAVPPASAGRVAVAIAAARRTGEGRQRP